MDENVQAIVLNIENILKAHFSWSSNQPNTAHLKAQSFDWALMNSYDNMRLEHASKAYN